MGELGLRLLEDRNQNAQKKRINKWSLAVKLSFLGAVSGYLLYQLAPKLTENPASTQCQYSGVDYCIGLEQLVSSFNLGHAQIQLDTSFLYPYIQKGHSLRWYYGWGKAGDN